MYNILCTIYLTLVLLHIHVAAIFSQLVPPISRLRCVGTSCLLACTQMA